MPDSLSGRLIALLLLALALAQIVSLLVFSHERGRAAEMAARAHVQNRIVSATSLLLDTPAPRQRQVLKRAQTGGLRIFLARQPRRIGPAESAEEKAYADSLRAELDDRVGRVHVRLRDGRDEGRPFIAVAVELPGGQWLLALKALREPPPRWSPASLLALALSALFLIAAVIIGVRGITVSLQRLASAADQLGRGETVAALPESGPQDLRLTARAFNQMRERLERFVSERTGMLAAISHDLRTPITALRLRAEFIEDEENRRRILEILDDMQHMTTATLDFARGENSRGATEQIDLTALVDALADDYRAMGARVEFEPGEKIVLNCRRGALKRALQNIIDNATHYGERARIGLHTTEQSVEIAVADDGPGIPESERERVFAPFVRLEPSRNQDSGGIGLGLSIARDIARAHGGDVLLRDSHQGQFEVLLRLPRREPGDNP